MKSVLIQAVEVDVNNYTVHSLYINLCSPFESRIVQY